MWAKRKEKVFGALTPLFFFEAYSPPLAKYTCLLRLGTGMVSLAVQGETPDRPLRPLFFFHASFLYAVVVFL